MFLPYPVVTPIMPSLKLLLPLLICRLSIFFFFFGNAFSFSSKSVSITSTSSSSTSSLHIIIRYRSNSNSNNNCLHRIIMMSAASAVRVSPRRHDDTYNRNKLHYLRRDDEDYISNNQGIIIDNAKRTSRYVRRERLRRQRMQHLHQEEHMKQQQQQHHHHHLLDWMDNAHYYQGQGDDVLFAENPLPQPSILPAPPLLVNTPIPIINFRTNSDFPASRLPPSHWITHALPPLPFEDAKYSNCITLRSSTPNDVGGEKVDDKNEVAGRKTIRILVPCRNENECYLLDEDEENIKIDQKSTTQSSSSVSMESLSSSSSSSSCVYIHGVKYSIQTINEGEEVVVVVVPHQRNEVMTTSTNRIEGGGEEGGNDDDDNNNKITDNSNRAYWLQTKLHNAIYGQVRRGTVLQRLEKPIVIIKNSTTTTMSSSHQSRNEEHEDEIIEWMATSTSVAIKQMSWDTILSQRGKLAEDPITEVAAMQYLQDFICNELQLEQHQQEESESSIKQEQQHHRRHHIMMPLDLLTDNEYLYSITPFCTGGRLLDVLENKSRFSEPEARYWMRQILKGLACLKQAGVAHRDMSPENLMVHEGCVYIIDMGMSIRIPSLQNNEEYGMMQRSHQSSHMHPQQRSLILPQSPCGKWYYLSPEVCLSEQPFDGPAVDLWAAGVILFIMLTGLPPWEEPTMSDENFRLMSTGHLMRLLTERRVGLSVDAMDLLQRMFWYDPADRLSLEQVCDHPWITHEKYNISS